MCTTSRSVERSLADIRDPAEDWKNAFSQRTPEGFAAAFAPDIELEATTLNLPVRGRDKVKLVMAAASKIYKSLQFTDMISAGPKQYLEWIAEAHAGVRLSGVTVLTRGVNGSIVHVAIHHRPMDAAIFFAETLRENLRNDIDPAHFVGA
jgi:hypothetical protein